MIWTSNHQPTSLSIRVTVVGVWEGGGVANFHHVPQLFGLILIQNTNYCSGPNINFLALSFCFCSSYSSQWTWKQKHPTAKVCLCLWVVCASRRKSSDPHIKESFDSKINKSGHDCAVDEARLSALRLWSFYFFSSFAAVGYLSIISESPEINLLIKLGRVPRACSSMRA